jgi:hypothetical protein
MASGYSRCPLKDFILNKQFIIILLQSERETDRTIRERQTDSRHKGSETGRHTHKHTRTHIHTHTHTRAHTVRQTEKHTIQCDREGETDRECKRTRPGTNNRNNEYTNTR